MTRRLQVGGYLGDGFWVEPGTKPLQRCHRNAIDHEINVGAGNKPVHLEKIGPIGEAMGRYFTANNRPGLDKGMGRIAD